MFQVLTHGPFPRFPFAIGLILLSFGVLFAWRAYEHWSEGVPGSTYYRDFFAVSVLSGVCTALWGAFMVLSIIMPRILH